MRFKQIICILLSLALLLGMTACGANEAPVDTEIQNSQTDESADVEEEDVQEAEEARYTISDEPLVFISDKERNFLLTENAAKIYDKNELDATTGTVIDIDMDNQKQEINGFGATISETSVVAMSQVPAEEIDKAYVRLFDKEQGIGLNIIRNTIGASDFAVDYYTYDDMPEGEEDYELKHFDFSRELEGVVPYTKKAYNMIGEEDFEMILSPWTAPLWMKSEYKWQGKYRATLRRECYNVYAKYLVKSIQAWEKQGIHVDVMTPQNEPWSANNWPGMWWDWESLANFANDYLRPALDNAGLDIKILNNDNDYKYVDNANNIMSATMMSTDGVAYHWYSGEPEMMAETAEIFPDALIYVTEASSSRPYSLGTLLRRSQSITRCLRNGANAYVLWNLALDQEGGPTYDDINTHCVGIITCDSETGKVSYSHDYYALAHYSKYIHKGARVIDSTDTGTETNHELDNVVTLNPNGTMTAVVTNYLLNEDRVCKIVLDDKVMEVNVPARSAMTITWDANVYK